MRIRLGTNPAHLEPNGDEDRAEAEDADAEGEARHVQ